MSLKASSDAVKAANAYESLHVPSLFAEWVGPVLDASGVGPGDRVVDLACGTGILARGAMRRVGHRGSVTGVDPDAGMLAVAARVEPAATWRLGSAEDIPVETGSQDALVSQFGAMFFRDPDAAVNEMRRVVRAGGRVTVAVWDALDRSPAYTTLVDLLEEMAGTDAADALRAPFALGDTDALARPFVCAGFENLELITASGTARFPSVRTMVEADLRGWLPIMGVSLSEDEVQAILDASEQALAPFVADDGRTAFPTSAHILSALID